MSIALDELSIMSCHTIRSWMNSLRVSFMDIYSWLQDLKF